MMTIWRIFFLVSLTTLVMIFQMLRSKICLKCKLSDTTYNFRFIDWYIDLLKAAGFPSALNLTAFQLLLTYFINLQTLDEVSNEISKVD